MFELRFVSAITIGREPIVEVWRGGEYIATIRPSASGLTIASAHYQIRHELVPMDGLTAMRITFSARG